MDARQQRGLVIAALTKINRNSEGWLVPSQSASERIYRVSLEDKTCTCPDHQEGGHVCKHWWAVSYTVQRECRPDGTMIETKSITFTEKKSYTQNWPKYNLAQQVEKDRFQVLLADLCRGVADPFPQHTKGGRPWTPMSDMVFASLLKIYSGFSSRRFACDLKEAHERGYLACPKPMNSVSVCAYLQNKMMTPILHKLIVQSSLPLRAVESHFATDSSGFATCRYLRWFDEKYGTQRTTKRWVKCHLACGVKTGIVTAVVIEDQHAADSPQFAKLIGATAQNFTINAVSADKGYLSNSNLELVESLGGTPFVPFKANSSDGGGEGAWGRMWHYYQFNREQFAAKYHLRSNVESTFSAIKRKFGEAVRSKNDSAMVNEVLGKVLCHNVCACIASHCELGIEPVFWTEEPSAVKTTLPFACGTI
jgi:transposase